MERKRAQYIKKSLTEDKHPVIGLFTFPDPDKDDELRGTIPARNSMPVLTTISEDKTGKGNMDYRDDYSKYDPEPSADEFLKNSGATIISSYIDVNNRRFYKRLD